MLRRFLVAIVILASLPIARVAGADVPASLLARAEERLERQFATRGVPYPPQSVTLVALKAEARLELWAGGDGGSTFIRSYLVRASSGQLGPKLRQGDHQVPEGVYRVAAVNPNSRFHLSLALDYPNLVDQARAREDHRADLGGSIMIHGEAVSDGCLPVGNAGIEELFALATRVGVEHVAVIISPLDLRRSDGTKVALTKVSRRSAWLGDLYAELARAMKDFALPQDGGDLPAKPARRVRFAAPKCKAYDAKDCVARCETGDAASCARAGVLYEDGRRIAPDVDKAWSLLQKACAGGDALGCGALSQLFLSDDGLKRDAARAAELAQVACDGGDGHGCYYLSKLCNERLIYPGTGAACSAERVEKLREQAVAALWGDCGGWRAYDCQTLATIYASGDSTTAHELAAGSCQSGDPGGCDELGQLYEHDGDLTRAQALYGRACETGYARACERIAGAVAMRQITSSR
jgi:TPR repeat protein